MKLTVHYLDGQESEVYPDVSIEDTNPAFILVREKTTSYGGSRTVRIPWALIWRVITEN